MTETQQIKFFETEADDTNIHSQFLHKKKQLGNYVTKLDFHINKARILQEKTLNRKKYNLINILDKMKDQILKQSEKTRKMQEYFYEHCEKILKEDIQKWDCNKDFFQNMFQVYDSKIKEKRMQIDILKEKVRRKTTELKQKKRIAKKQLTIDQLSEKLLTDRKSQREKQQTKTKNTIDTEISQLKSKRLKTQIQLPSLTKILRAKTLTDQYQPESQIRNYMRPIKTQKISYDFQTSQNLLEMLSWYKEDKQKEYNWFEKLIFVDRNFKKIVQAIKNK